MKSKLAIGDFVKQNKGDKKFRKLRKGEAPDGIIMQGVIEGREERVVRFIATKGMLMVKIEGGTRK